MIELRLDAMPYPDLEAVMAGRPEGVPLIVTCRRMTEGGAIGHREEQKGEWLVKAAELGAEFIDIELMAGDALREKVIKNKGGAKVIVSWHNLMMTPERRLLRRVVRQAFEAGADICKLVSFARKPHDNGRLLEVVTDHSRRGKPMIGFCLGELGTFSRVATLYMGGLLSFAYLRQNMAVMPGMISVDELNRYLNEFKYYWPPRPAGCPMGAGPASG